MAVSLRETHGRLCVLWSSTLFHKCFTFTMNFAGGRLASAPVSLYSCDFGTSVRHITSVPILYHHFLFKQKKVHGRSSSVHQRYRPYTKGWNEKVCPHSLPTTPFLPGFYPNFYSGSIISVTNTPGSFCRLMYPPYFSTTRLIRFNPCP